MTTPWQAPLSGAHHSVAFGTELRTSNVQHRRGPGASLPASTPASSGLSRRRFILPHDRPLARLGPSQRAAAADVPPALLLRQVTSVSMNAAEPSEQECEQRRARVQRLEQRIIAWLAVTCWVTFSGLSSALAAGAYQLFQPPTSVAWAGLGVFSMLGGVLGVNYDHVLAALGRTRRGRALLAAWRYLTDDYIR